jgi:Cu+-exporting ATPase
MQSESTIESRDGDQSAAAGSSRLAIQGMTCANCARHVTDAIQSVPGVDSALVDLGEASASVRWLPGAQRDLAAIVGAVEKAGYGARPVTVVAHEHSAGRSGLPGWQLNLWLGVGCTLLLMIGEWILGWGMVPWFRWLSFALAGLVQVVAGARFYRGAWNQLRAGSSNMDTLVALGSTTAFGFSAWVLLSGRVEHLYFMEAAAIISVISLGHWMESRMGAHASSALRKLLHLAPQTARRRGRDGTEADVPVAELRESDVVHLLPGDRVPTDGAVAEGESVVDESMLTGESSPVEKSAGSTVYAGTVNLNGHLLVRVTATGEQTALARVIAAVQRAQTSRANIQRLGDRVSSIFVPVVVVVAVVAGLWWGLAPASAVRVHAWLSQFLWPAHVPAMATAAAFITAAAVLIVACPCAMGLATPVAIMAGSNAAAQRGILIRDGVALEKAGRITTVVFDKTGTLTVGKPAVVRIWVGQASGEIDPLQLGQDTGKPGADSEEARALGRAATLARNSRHPVSQAIARLSDRQEPIRDWQEVFGSGLQGRGQDARGDWHAMRLGSWKWLRSTGVNLSAAERFAGEWSGQGATLVGLAVETSLEAAFAVKDTLKTGAAEVVARLRREGLNACLVTGDNALTARSIARRAGIQEELVFAEVRPEAKAELVKQLQQKGGRVAFVGDGINDAPALEQADLGIAVGRASDIAREAADILLLNSEIEAVPEGLGLARATLRTIRQNLFWAFFYNAISVPLAALGFMSPILCAAAMGFSDLLVIGNALRLRNWRLR